MNRTAAKSLIARCIQLRATGRTEAVLRAEFQSWLRQIFPDSSDEAWVNHYSEGSEAHTKIGTRAGTTANRFIDNLVRSTVIEYEADLRQSSLRDHGRDQVREYVAGTVRAGTPVSQARGILSDTVDWHVYEAELRSEIAADACTADDVTLREVDSFYAASASDEEAERFAAFLKKHLAREQSRTLNASNIVADIGLESLPFGRHVQTLTELVEQGKKNDSSIALATDLWSRFVDGLERSQSGFRVAMYVDEMYVAILARLLAANVLEGKAMLSDDAGLSDILTGVYFAHKFRLKNMVEDDYFGWILRGRYVDALMPIAREIQHDLYAYDFSRLEEQDLFGKLMAQLARRSQRKLLGQELTPAWLAKELAVRCLDRIPVSESPRVVDMCCGSGSILAEVIKEQLRRITPKSLDEIASVATGFDIDPLAVMLAKTTWVITLAPQLQKATTDVIIPIYHADSLFATTPVSKLPAPGEDADIKIELDGRSISIPGELIRPEFRALFDDIVDWAYDEAKATARDEKDEVTEERAGMLVEGLITRHGLNLSLTLKDRLVESTFKLAQRMTELAKANRNGIWAFILRNTYRPGLLVGQFNGLVSNPPWLAMSQLANNPYKGQLSSRSLLYGIKPSGASHLHLELATTYLIHAIDRYLSSGAAVACLLPGTIFKGHHQQKFRDAAYLRSPRKVAFELQEVWEVASGTFKVRSAAVVGTKKESVAAVQSSPKGLVVSQSGTTEVAFTVARRDQRTAWVLGATASSESPAASEAVPPQGADLMPRTAVCVEVVDATGAEWRVRTPGPGSQFFFSVKDAKQLKAEQFPGFVAPRFIYRMVQSLNVLPFACVEPFVSVAIPAVRGHSGEWTLIDPDEIRTLGLRNTAQRFSKIDDKLEGKPLVERINERNKLVVQVFPKDHYLVLSGAGGGVSCGACISVNKYKDIIVDQTLYWRLVSSAKEAWFRVGLLNSEAMTDAIRVFNPEGEFGGRHPHTLPHRFIPGFDPESTIHSEIAKHAEELSQAAFDLAGDDKTLADPNRTISSRRRKLRSLLHNTPQFAELERLCSALLAAQ